MFDSSKHYCTRRLEFDAAHRVLLHESKCKHLHGHRYVAEVTISANNLDTLGRVIDFGVIKSIIGCWVDDNWDHNILLNSEDPLLKLIAHCELTHTTEQLVGQRKQAAENGPTALVFCNKRPYIFSNINPTAETIAAELLKVSTELLKGHPELTVEQVRIYETPNCWADCYASVPPVQLKESAKKLRTMRSL